MVHCEPNKISKTSRGKQRCLCARDPKNAAERGSMTDPNIEQQARMQNQSRVRCWSLVRCRTCPDWIESFKQVFWVTAISARASAGRPDDAYRARFRERAKMDGGGGNVEASMD